VIGEEMKLTVEEFIQLRDIIYDKAGLFFEEKKIYFVKKRVEQRLEALAIPDVTEYYNLLKYKDKAGRELQVLLNRLTTNETFFFREENQLNVFRDHCLPEVIDFKRRKRENTIKIWSAGCSSGEEPYTLAILLKEKIIDFSSWNIVITGTDIDTEILEKAKTGVYNERSLRFTAPNMLAKYFTRNQDNEYIINFEIKKMVTFHHVNLFDSLKMRIFRGIDFIFCRNVLIYFDDTARKSVMANFYDSLNPGGYIYLGHSESVTRINSAFDIKRAGGFIVHQKPGPKEVKFP
jgi:chemotaxis protein methyltransferase CheR